MAAPVSQQVENDKQQVADASERQSKSGRALLFGALFLLLTTGGVTGASFAARYNWMCDLASHFPLQLAIGVLPAVCILVVARRWILALVATTVLTVNVAAILPFYLAIPADPVSADPVSVGNNRVVRHRVTVVNVLRSNREREKLNQFIESTLPDVFSVLEMDAAWLKSIENLKTAYPHSVTEPRESNFGIGLFSRTPILSHRVVSLGRSEAPTIVAEIELQDQRITVVSTHPPPPVSRFVAESRNQQLRKLSRLVAELRQPVVVVGDLNISPWSPHFQDLLESAQLNDARRGFGLNPTWPGNAWPMRIPIDHILVTDHVRVHAFQVGPAIGSDHRPVTADFTLRQ